MITIQFKILKQLPSKPFIEYVLPYFIEMYYPPESSQTIFIGFRRQIRAKLHLHRSISTLPFQIQYTFSPSLSTHLYGPAAGLEVLLSRLDARLQVADVRAEPAPTAVRCSVLKKEKKKQNMIELSLKFTFQANFRVWTNSICVEILLIKFDSNWAH